jgi:hypothetical protein
MRMQRAFSIPHVPVAIDDYSPAPRRANIHAALQTAGNRCLLLLRRLIDVMAAGGAMS